MKWQSRGRIFDPAVLPESYSIGEFAQAPQVLELDNCVRIFFSTRTRDKADGKFRSQVASIDMTKEFNHVLRVSESPVLPLGGMGCFDEHGIFPFSVTKRGTNVLAYTTGWSRRVSVPVETAIGLAVSNDQGLSFSRVGAGPILGPTLEEPFLVGDAFVREFGGALHMWYIFGTKWQEYPDSLEPERTYKIAHAVSSDGKSWKRGGRCISDILTEPESQALPTVLEFDERFHMVFCYRFSRDFRSNSSRAYRLGYATSSDLKRWDRIDDALDLPPSPDGFDSLMRCYPHLTAINGRYFLLYNGDEFGRWGFGLAELVQ